MAHRQTPTESVFLVNSRPPGVFHLKAEGHFNIGKAEGNVKPYTNTGSTPKLEPYEARRMLLNTGNVQVENARM